MTTADKAAPAPAKSYQRLAIEKVVAARGPGDPAAALYALADAQATLAAFETADTAAIAAQERYQRWKERGLQATTFGVFVGALLLLPFGDRLDGWPRTVIGALQTLALLTTFAAIVIVAKFKPQDSWMISRGTAERLRGEIFERVAAAQVSGDAGTVASAKLALIREAYIDDQVGFFEKRTRDHRKRASETSPLRIAGYLVILLAVALGAVVTLRALGVAPVLVVARVDQWIGLAHTSQWQLALTTWASGILSYATARSLMHEDARKAALYDVTAKKLKTLIRREYAVMSVAAARGENAAVAAFFDKARTILEQEHAVWSFVHDFSDDEGTASAEATSAR